MALPSPQPVKQFVGERLVLTWTFSAGQSVTGHSFTFAVARTLAEALAGTGLVERSTDDDVDVNSATEVSCDLTGADGSASLAHGEYVYVLRMDDSPDNAVAGWGPWICVGA